MKSKLLSRMRTGDSGFSAIEALVSVVIFSVITLIAVTVFQSGQKAARNATIQGDSQQSARVAMDLITGDLRTLGYGLELAGGQRALVYGGPWDIIFNANSGPTPDDFLAPGFPRSMNLTMAPSTVAGLYTPIRSFGGAETIRYTLDSTGDGSVDTTDVADDPEEATPNPRDFVLRKEVYGELADGTNGGAGEPVSVVRGPLADGNGALPRPLFQYWYDNDDDPATPDLLHGDTNADGTLSQGEIAAMTVVPTATLPLVTRVVVTVTAEDGQALSPGEYRTRELVSSVSFRNEIRRAGVITGIVFQDANSDGKFDIANEAPIQGITVRLDIGTTATTDATGRYAFKVTPGTYMVTEFDLPGYVSTTPNAVSVTVVTGGTAALDFGDKPGSGVGTLQGTVYNDANQNATMEGTEPGIQNVVVTLHTGQTDTTDASGFYSFAVPVGSYTIVETDSAGYTSTTPNAVAAVLSVDGEVITTDFGDVFGGATGTINGTVWDDQNMNAVLDGTEPGIADVSVLLVGSASVDSATTDGSGNYSANVAPGQYTIIETDPVGYTSTTPNMVLNMFVQQDSTVTVDFGDLLQTSLNFTVVTVGQTDRALAIASYDMGEDNKGDSDIILGTELGAGFNNLHVWHNARKNSGTALAGLFNSSPDFSRNTGAPVPVLEELDANLDGMTDVLTGLDATTGSNLQFWVTKTSNPNKGTFNNSPDAIYSTNSGSSVLSVTGTDWPGISSGAALVGTYDATGIGHVEVWQESGSLSYTHLFGSDLYFDAQGSFGEINGLAVGDFNADGTPDLAIGQDMGNGTGRVSVLLGDAAVGLFSWVPYSELTTDGVVHSLVAVDMKEDSGGDVDLLVGTSNGTYSGSIELFLNDGMGNFGLKVGNTFVRDDWIDAGGDVLSLKTELMDPDVFPDLVAGTRTNAYSGELLVFNGLGYLPSTGTAWSHTASGEVVTMTLDDFNLDGLWDIAVGTRTSSSTGELVVYFGQ